MRLISCEYRAQSYLAAVRGEEAVLPALAGAEINDMLSLIAAGPLGWRAYAAELDQCPASCRVPLNAVRLLAPIPRPRKNVICLGLNYADHAAESLTAHKRPVELPEHPVVFTKAVTSVTGHDADIALDVTVSEQLDWEVELAVIIGEGGRRITEERALEHVFGYTVLNDLSARDLQFRHKQYFLGKSLDGACPMGPWIVTSDEVGDPQRLDLRCWVNGDLKQSSNTRYQLFPVAKIIAILSRGMRLEPGDIIATGTPAGVGFARTPPEFLQAGDVVECEVEGIGRLRNRIVAYADQQS